MERLSNPGIPLLLGCAHIFSVWLFLYNQGAAVGWGSRKEMLVNRLGDNSSFEKFKIFYHVPAFILFAAWTRYRKELLSQKLYIPTDSITLQVRRVII